MTSELKRSTDLKDEAEKIIKDLDLLTVLGKYGVPNIVGSVALNLMTWRDIDLEAICSTSPKKSDALAVANRLFLHKDIRKVSLIDFQKFQDKSKPKGQYIGARYKRDLEWKLDIWLVSKKEARAFHDVNIISKKLNADSRQTILELKTLLHSNPKYRKEIFSSDIYDAVIENGVTDLGGFKKYLLRRNIEL